MELENINPDENINGDFINIPNGEIVSNQLISTNDDNYDEMKNINDYINKKIAEKNTDNYLKNNQKERSFFDEINYLFYIEIYNEISNIQDIISKKKIYQKSSINKISQNISDHEKMKKIVSQTEAIHVLTQLNLEKNLNLYRENISKIKDFTLNESEKLTKLDSIVKKFNIQKSWEIELNKLNRFPFESNSSNLFVNFKIHNLKHLMKNSLDMVKPAFIYIPLKMEKNEIDLNLTFFNYHDNNNELLHEILTLQLFQYDSTKGFKLKYISFKMEENLNSFSTMTSIIDKLKFLENKIVNKQLFYKFRSFCKDCIHSQQNYLQNYLRINVTEKEVKIPITEDSILVVKFERKDEFVNKIKKNSGKLYQIFIDIFFKSIDISKLINFTEKMLIFLFLKNVQKGTKNRKNKIFYFKNIKMLNINKESTNKIFFIKTERAEKIIYFKDLEIYEKNDKMILGETPQKLTLEQIRNLFN